MSVDSKANQPTIGLGLQSESSQEANDSGYQDAVHLRALRKALAKGNAAVMVGSGFSRNAEGGSNVGTWDDLAEALAAGMSGGDTKIPFSAANATQLAEQYERLFSRPALEQVLREVVPDERLAPGHLHSSLLSLPWSEVLTTNYDTLLERTAETLLDSTYFTISCREDIPQSRVLGRRRIVKLHGSFASHRPFIVTEEDYRRYPDDFAPFVNLVRQSLLENVMCLVGFSGDDPNFLHWIGWVRDMQDKHALPIYLLLSKAPALGQQKLLQARGVTPVVLPPSVSNEESDYEGRYRRLFQLLAEPLEGSFKQWGEISLLREPGKSLDTPDERYATFVECLPVLSQHRNEYPGWMIAPQTVRRRLERSTRGSGSWFDHPGIVKRIELDHPAFGLAAFELYGWIQSILLIDLNDDVARQALELLEKTEAIHYSDLSDEIRKRLEGFRIKSQNDLADTWTSLAVEVTNWARRGHWETEYQKTCALLRHRRQGDPQVSDHLAYQDVLHCLHHGKRSDAVRLLTRWRVRGGDVYMEVRRAVLLAELGNLTVALTNCEKAVQLLRQQQRLRPDDPRLLSEESWACLVANQLQGSVEQLRRVGMAVDHADAFEPAPSRVSLGRDTEVSVASAKDDAATSTASEEGLSEKFDVRVKTLGTRGYASDEELRLALVSLGEESGVPYAENFRYNSFSLGSTSSRTLQFGTASEGRERQRAAMSWLQLAERVGLTPRAGRMLLHSDAFMQAAWWLRYVEANPLRRGFGILFRCMREESLKPKDETQPLHKTGWLSRFQVATLSNEDAELSAEVFISNLENIFASLQRVRDSKRDLNFSAEVFGRLVLRVCSQGMVMEWGERLIAIHGLRGMQASPETWAPMGRAVAQCLEALDPPNQRRLLFRALQVPTPAAAESETRWESDWLNIYTLFVEVDPLRSGDVQPELDWGPVIVDLLQQLKLSRADGVKKGVWLRLFIVDELGLLNETQRRMVGSTLWAGWDRVTWPSMSGFNPNATLRWPAPLSIDVELEYRRYLLGEKLRPFSSGGTMRLNARSGRSWSIPGDESLSNALLVALRGHVWPRSDYHLLVNMIEEWLDTDGEDLAKDAIEPEDRFELRLAIAKHLRVIDDMVAKVLAADVKAAGRADDTVVRVRSLRERLRTLELPMWRVDVLLAARQADAISLVSTQGQLQAALTSRDEQVLVGAYRAVGWLLQESVGGTAPDQRYVFECLVNVVVAKVMPGLVFAIDVLSAQNEEVWAKYLDLRTLYLLDAALNQFEHDLAIFKRAERTGIPDDAVPLLRSKCAQLAYALRRHAIYESPAAMRWLDAARDDPLPELRLSRFRAVVDHNGLAN